MKIKLGDDRIQIYVAGPITPQGKVGKHPVIEFLDNVRRGVRWCVRVWQEGFMPFCAFFDFVYWLVLKDDEEISESMIKNLSMTFVESSKGVFVMPNEKGYTTWQDSSGVKAEIERAEELKIPVFYTLKALKKHFKKK